MSGVLLGHPVTLPGVTTKRGPLPVIGPAELEQVRALYRERRRLEDELDRVKARTNVVVAEMRDRFPGRGTVTMMADVATEELDAGKPEDQQRDRRTQLSRQIGTARSTRQGLS